MRKCCICGGRSKLSGNSSPLTQTLFSRFVIRLPIRCWRVARQTLACSSSSYWHHTLASLPTLVALPVARARIAVSCGFPLQGEVLIVQQVPEEGFCFDPRTHVTLHGTPARDVTRALLGGATTQLHPLFTAHARQRMASTLWELWVPRRLRSCSSDPGRRTWRSCCRG